MSAIDNHYQLLSSKGVDLRQPLAPEEDAGYGGRVRRYERGNIYWHGSTGAHEISGGILNLYLRAGGPGPNPATGKRELGFPTSDGKRGADRQHPLVEFEWGAILWVAGTGGVYIHGKHHAHWKARGGELGELGYPITNHLTIAGGEIAYFQGGALFAGPVTGGQVIEAATRLPLIGRPTLANPQADVRLTGAITWTLSEPIAKRIRAERPDLFLELWRGRLVLEEAARPESTADEHPLVPVASHLAGTANRVPIDLTVRAKTLGERKLFNVGLRRTDGKLFPLSPHCLYTKSSWSTFGFAHTTDLHVSRRLESFRGRLKAAGRAESAAAFTNCNDRVREFIRYANRLHDRGLLDVVIATGDLVDYAFEDGDNRRGAGNFGLLVEILRGRAQPTDEDGVVGEELRVPIFTTLGNHDYRPNPYMLYCEIDVDIPLYDNPTPRAYEGFNLTEADALAIQGGRPTISSGAASAQVRPDAAVALPWYRRWINRDEAYAVELGNHRIVMLDSGRDYGVPSSLGEALATKTGFGDEDERLFLDGNPNSIGIKDRDLDLVRNALYQAGQGGIVVVGVHAPLLNAYGSEYPHYLRETEHPTAPRSETVAYLWRRGRIATLTPDKNARLHAEWSQTGTPHFKVGGVGDLLDFSVSKGKAEQLLDLCVGRGVGRPVDLVLCGHVHRNVEYRLKANAAKGFRFLTDYYSANPPEYYPSIKVGHDQPVHVRVRPGAPFNGQPSMVRDHRGGGLTEFFLLDVPPYAHPLAEAKDKRGWWTTHRPLHIQTAALGQTDHHQRRLKPAEQAEPRRPVSFQGFRVMLMRGDAIAAAHYVTFKELRAHDGSMPWDAKQIVVPDVIRT